MAGKKLPRELRLTFAVGDKALIEYMRSQAELARRSFPAQAYIMLKYAAAQMSAHDHEAMEKLNGGK